MKLRLTARAVVTAAVLAVGLASCSDSGSESTDQTSGTTAGATQGIPKLTVGTPTLGAGTMDPTKGLPQFTEFMYERLMGFDADGNLKPELATSVDQPNPTTYVYHLRQGVKFWDGNEMTAADVVDSLDYQRAPEAQSAANFESVESVTATDDYTVTVTLKHPDASWQYVPAYAGWIFEKKFREEHGDQMGTPGALIQATGPWKLDSFDPNSGAEFSANPTWWGGEVPIEHITGKFFAEENSMALAFRAGDIDAAFPRDGRAFAATSGTEVTTTYPAGAVGYLIMNPAIPPWDDIHVRRAAAYAMNRQDFVDARGGYSDVVDTLIPRDQLERLGSKEEVDAVLESLPQYPYDIEKAKAELAQSAYPNGFTASADVPNYSIYPTMNQIIAAQLAKIGITLELNQVDIGKWVSDFTGTKDYAPSFLTYFAVTPDPSGQVAAMLGRDAAWNGAGYTPPEIEQFAEKGLATSDPAERLAIYGDLLNKVATDVPYVPLFVEYANLVLSDKYTVPDNFNIFAQRTYWPMLISAS